MENIKCHTIEEVKNFNDQFIELFSSLAANINVNKGINPSVTRQNKRANAKSIHKSTSGLIMNVFAQNDLCDTLQKNTVKTLMTNLSRKSSMIRRGNIENC